MALLGLAGGAHELSRLRHLVAGGEDLSHAEAVAPVWVCATCGNGLDAACATPGPGCRIDQEFVIRRLEMAGETLLSMRMRSPYPAPYRCAFPEGVHEAMLAYGWSTERVRPACPSSQDIDAMDRVYRWLSLIPQHRHVIRRIVAARSLIDPQSGRHVIHWRKLAGIIRADYRAVQRWHAQGIAMIVQALSAR